MEAFHVWNQTTAHWLSAYSNAALVKKQNNNNDKKNKQKNTKKQKTKTVFVYNDGVLFSVHINLHPFLYPILFL